MFGLVRWNSFKTSQWKYSNWKSTSIVGDEKEECIFAHFEIDQILHLQGKDQFMSRKQLEVLTFQAKSYVVCEFNTVWEL